MKMHAGVFGGHDGIRPDVTDVEQEDVEAVRAGAEGNLDRHIRNMLRFGVPVVVSINRFSSDHEGELEVLEASAIASGAHAVVRTTVHGEGGAGGFGPCTSRGRRMSGSSGSGATLHALDRCIDGHPRPDRANRHRTLWCGWDPDRTGGEAPVGPLREVGLWDLPVCMAKTQYSFSHDPSLLGAPTGFTVPVREFRLSTGAGFIVAILGNMMTMPGLPARWRLRRWTSTSMETLSGMFS